MTFVDLVAATLRHGLVPIVVPELKTITIGGAVSGCSIESMSFGYGGFHDTCLEYEVITATGEVLRCTPDNEHALVFQMMHGSFGTLGILSKLTFQLVPAKPFVHARLREATRRSPTYQAAIRAPLRARRTSTSWTASSTRRRCYVLCVGRFVDEAPYTNRYDWMKVYYQSTRDARRGLPDDAATTSSATTAASRTCTRSRSSAGCCSASSWLGAVAAARRQAALAARRREQPDGHARRVPAVLEGRPSSSTGTSASSATSRCGACRTGASATTSGSPTSFYAGMQDELFLDLAIYGMQQTRRHATTTA